MSHLIKLIINTISIYFLAYLLPGIDVKNYLTAVCIAIVLTPLNTIVKPVLILFTLPLTIFSLGLFLLIINGLIVLLSDYLIDGFYVSSIWTAILFSILLSILQSILLSFLKEDKN